MKIIRSFEVSCQTHENQILINTHKLKQDLLFMQKIMPKVWIKEPVYILFKSIIIIIIIYFQNVSYRDRHLPWYEASPHIPEQFRVQTQLIHVSFYTFSPSSGVFTPWPNRPWPPFDSEKIGKLGLAPLCVSTRWPANIWPPFFKILNKPLFSKSSCPCLYSSPLTTSTKSTFLQDDTQSSPHLRSICQNHASPCSEHPKDYTSKISLGFPQRWICRQVNL